MVILISQVGLVSKNRPLRERSSLLPETVLSLLTLSTTFIVHIYHFPNPWVTLLIRSLKQKTKPKTNINKTL